MIRLHRRPRCRAFILMDSVFGLLLVAALLTTVLLTVGHQRRAERTLARRRADYRLAEAAAYALLAGQTLPADARVQWLSDPSPVPGRAWARVSIGGASLVALAPHAAAGVSP